MDKQDVFDYVMKTPDNTNPAILREMLDEVSSGGNPNYVEIIKGTVANPWGGKNPNDLFIEAENNNCTLRMTIDGTAIGIGEFDTVFYPHSASIASYWFEAIGTSGPNASDWSIGTVAYYADGEFSSMRMLNSGSVINLADYASAFNSVLIIVHHPLPEDNT